MAYSAKAVTNHSRFLLLAGPTSLFQKDEVCFYQYLEYLMTNLEDLDSVERFAKGYEDYLQAPLQPLMDNLESQVK